MNNRFCFDSNKVGYQIAYGLDPVPYPGYFFQVFKLLFEDERSDGFVVDLDVRAHMSETLSTRTEIMLAMKRWGAPKQHVDEIFAAIKTGRDLPFTTLKTQEVSERTVLKEESSRTT